MLANTDWTLLILFSLLLHAGIVIQPHTQILWLLRAEMSLCPQPGREGRKEGGSALLQHVHERQRPCLDCRIHMIWCSDWGKDNFTFCVSPKLLRILLQSDECENSYSVEGQSIIPPCSLGQHLLVSILKDKLSIKMAFLGSAGRRQPSPVSTS